jgi:Putative DNA-binding domain
MTRYRSYVAPKHSARSDRRGRYSAPGFDGLAESPYLDYKQETYGDAGNDRSEFLADISSFANTLGGDLVIGVAEANGLPTALAPFAGDCDAEKRRLEQIALSGLEPRIPNLQIHSVPIAAGGHVFIVRVPRSFIPPHRVIARDSNRFCAAAEHISDAGLSLHLDASQHTALGCLAMAWLIRKSAALIAVYSIALQALLWGFAPAGHFGFDPFAIICTSDSSGGHDPSLPQHRSDCDACLVACSGSPALVPAGVAFSLVFLPDGPKRLALLVEAPSLQPRHQPQSSRAPPIPS